MKKSFLPSVAIAQSLMLNSSCHSADVCLVAVLGLIDVSVGVEQADKNNAAARTKRRVDAYFEIIAATWLLIPPFNIIIISIVI
ncbi:MAG: hypothetical protein ACWGOY_02570 [Anaerolineales bacterium]